MTGASTLMIGLDAAEWQVVEPLARGGELPVLGELLRAGAYGVLQSVADEYAGGVWPTFYTGKPVPWHGIYHSKLWRPERMRCEVASGSWLAERPFWERDTLAGARTCAVDVPMLVAEPAPIRGLQVAGWGTHDLIVKSASPRTAWRDLRRRHGAPVLEPERFGPQTARSLRRLRENLLQSTGQMGDVCEDLLRRQRWDLFLAVLGAPHRAGHYLWDPSRSADGAAAGDLKDALVDVYRACDTQLGRLIEAAGGGARVLVFAVHGMGRNRGWSDLCPGLLERIRTGGAPGPKQGFLYTLKRRLPTEWSERAVALLPRAARHRLVSIWSARMLDWSTARHFPLPMDQAGYLRVNLRGREPQGIVEAGVEYDRLLAELEAALSSWRDLETGAPIVDRVVRAYAGAPADAPYREGLPDLIVTWSDRSALDSPGIRSPDLGELRFDTPGRLPSGRSGNHTPRGWFIAAGPGTPPGEIPGGHILDLAPTVFDWLQTPRPADLHGRSLFPARR